MKRFMYAAMRCLVVLFIPSKFILHLSSCYREDVDLSIDRHNKD